MKRIIPIIILVAALGGGYGWFAQSPEAASGSTALVGSGSIEAETVAITAELGGRVMALEVEEGQAVTAGQILVELDKADLLAQKAQLEKAVAAAQANLELVKASARPEDIALARAQVAQAEAARAGAGLSWAQIRAMLSDPHALEAKINQAKAQVAQAESQLESAQVELKRAEIKAEAASRNQSNHAALVENEAAQKRLQAAQVGLQMAEVARQGAQTQVELLIQLWHRPLQLMAQANAAEAAYGQAEAAVLAAEANLAVVKADPMPEDIAIARAQVLETEAALKAVEVQLAKQTLLAPRAGLISQRLVEPGELAQPGQVLLELSDIETVELTVYVPETQIGQVKIGHKARVFVDAYGDERFEGLVSFIAHQAEFTPKNVQTQEERINLVFAVKITLANADHRLKPGMPADAEILVTSSLVSVSEQLSSPPRSQPTVAPTATPAPTRVTVRPTVEPPLSPVETEPVTYAEVIAWGLHVRHGPGLEQAVIATLTRGETAPVLETDPRTGWLQVALASGETGWISGSPTYVSLKKGPGQAASDLTGSDVAPTATPTPPPAKAVSSKKAEIISAGLNARSGPGVEYSLITSLAKGYTMSVIEVDPATGWLQVELPGYGQTGWIAGDPAYVVVK